MAALRLLRTPEFAASVEGCIDLKRFVFFCFVFFPLELSKNKPLVMGQKRGKNWNIKNDAATDDDCEKST